MNASSIAKIAKSDILATAFYCQLAYHSILLLIRLLNGGEQK